MSRVAFQDYTVGHMLSTTCSKTARFANLHIFVILASRLALTLNKTSVALSGHGDETLPQSSHPKNATVLPFTCCTLLTVSFLILNCK